MNDVNLNSPDLRLARAGEQLPARAISSSTGEGKGSAVAAVSPGPDSPSETKAIAETGVVPAGETGGRTEAAREELGDAVTRLNEYVQNVQRDLQFEVDNELGQTIVRVVDQQTQEVIRQIPDEVALRLAEKLQQDEPLTLFRIEV